MEETNKIETLSPPGEKDRDPAIKRRPGIKIEDLSQG